MAKKRLAGQRALVTGASSGIGAEIARELAREGANLILTARRKERLEGLAKELSAEFGIDAKVEACDLSTPGIASDLYVRTEGAGVAVDILVNNAGFGAYEDFVNIAWERYEGMLQVNVVALTQLSRLFLPKMIERRHGHLMNIASVGAYTPCPTFAVYAASKAYVRNMTEAIDFELKGTGVRAICINPGGTRTEFLDAASQKLTKTGELAMMTASQCAKIAVRKMLAGRRNVITGLMNALSMWLMRFLPRPMITWFAYQGMKSGVEKDTSKPLALPPPKAAGRGQGAEAEAGSEAAAAEAAGGDSPS